MIEEERTYQHTDIEEAIKQINPILEQEHGKEIFFDVTEALNQEGNPYLTLTNPLLPNSEEQLQEYVRNNPTRLEAMATTKARVFFPPDGSVELDKESIDIFDSLHKREFMYKGVLIKNPLKIIGRKNSEGNIELLYIKQLEKLPNTDFANSLPNTVQKYLMINALPNYIERSGLLEKAVELRKAFLDAKNLDLKSFSEYFVQKVQDLPYKEILKNFVKQWHDDYKEFPEYVQSVADALSETKYYETSVSTVEV